MREVSSLTIYEFFKGKELRTTVVSYYDISFRRGGYPLCDYRSFHLLLLPSRFLRYQVMVGPSRTEWSHCYPRSKVMCLYVSCNVYYDVMVVI